MSENRRRGLRTSEVAKLAGVNVQTLRYYERRGLIPAPQRTVGGHRTYVPETIRLVMVIKTIQGLGFSLDEIAAILEASKKGHITPSVRQELLDRLAAVNLKIQQLSAIRSGLNKVAQARDECGLDCNCTDYWPPFADVANTEDDR
ncbi:MerR family transcriptional regulator [Dactylosporangium sp. CA-092794]|uniref:MerR family transcriptional regulator n=1 Tax=Dactylosporangium sp. CA-092794 TaxID=3239929 RepID=UPI003D93D4BB